MGQTSFWWLQLPLQVCLWLFLWGIGLALVIGVIVNYIDAPVGSPGLIFGGVGLIVLAMVLNANAYKKLSASQNKVPTKGLLLAIVAGCLMGLFYKYVANSMFPDFSIPIDGKLSPYTAVFIFSLGILVSNFLFNTVLMRKPFEGPQVGFGDYFQGGSKNHLMGILGGIIWCLGMSFSILASDKSRSGNILWLRAGSNRSCRPLGNLCMEGIQGGA